METTSSTEECRPFSFFFRPLYSQSNNQPSSNKRCLLTPKRTISKKTRKHVQPARADHASIKAGAILYALRVRGTIGVKICAFPKVRYCPRRSDGPSCQMERGERCARPRNDALPTADASSTQKERRNGFVTLQNKSCIANSKMGAGDTNTGSKVARGVDQITRNLQVGSGVYRRERKEARDRGTLRTHTFASRIESLIVLHAIPSNAHVDLEYRTRVT